jgi:hypothetical protein
MSFPLLMSVADTYYRSVRVGDSEAHLGVLVVTALLRPFTPGEDAVVAWVLAQDACNLLDLVHLKDGRDLCIFERLYLKQSFEHAQTEADTYITRLLSMQHDTRNAPVSP